MKIVCLLLICLFTSASVAAQEINVCNLDLKSVPAVQNLKLGMSPEDVQTVFGRDLKIKIKKNGNRVFFQNFIQKPAPPSLNGVRALYLRFFDRQLYQIEIFYENKPEWQTLADFTRSLSATLGLPDDWQDARNRKVVNCVDFAVYADKILNPRVELVDRTTLARAEAFLEQQKKSN